MEATRDDSARRATRTRGGIRGRVPEHPHYGRSSAGKSGRARTGNGTQHRRGRKIVVRVWESTSEQLI